MVSNTKLKETKFILIFIFTFFPLLAQNLQEENNKVNHGKEYEKLLKKAVDMHKLLNELKKERKQDKEKHEELQKTMIRKLQRWLTPITPDQSQSSDKSSLLQESKKKVKKLNVYGIENIQTRTKSGVSQLKALPYSQLKQIPLPISLKNVASNFTLKLPKISGASSLQQSVKHKELSIKKNDLLSKLTNLRKKIEEAMFKCHSKEGVERGFRRELFSHEINSIVESLKTFNMKVGALVSEITTAEDLSYEKLNELGQRTQDLETNINELVNQLLEEIKKFDNLYSKLDNLEKLLSIIAEGKEPYSYLSLKERKMLYQSLYSEYKEIIDNELKPDKSVMSFFLFYKAPPKFIPKKTQTETTHSTKEITTQEEVLKELTFLLILTKPIYSLVTYSNNVIEFIESNLQTKQSKILCEPQDEKNCEDENWKEEVKEFITFEDGKVTLKDDFLYLSNKDALNKIIKKASDCSGEIPLPESVRKLFEDSKIFKMVAGKVNVVPITTYRDMLMYIHDTSSNNGIISKLVEDCEKIKTGIYRDLVGDIRSYAVAHSKMLDDTVIEFSIEGFGLKNAQEDHIKEQKDCIKKEICGTLKAQGKHATDVTPEMIEQAFKICNVTEAQKKEIIEYKIKLKIDNIGFEKLLKIAQNSDKIIKLSIPLFNSCSQTHLSLSEDILKVINFKLKYDAFSKTFNLLWDKFLSVPEVKREFLIGEDCMDWVSKRNPKTWQDLRAKHICIVQLHTHASRVLDDLYQNFPSNRDLLVKLCLDELKAIKSEKDKQYLQTQFEFLESLGFISKACRIIKIYQKKEIELNKISDFNARIEMTPKYCLH